MINIQLKLILISCVLFSCKKTNSVSSDITIGDTNQMYVQFLNVNLDGDYYDPEIYELDLNNDGIKDISFRSEIVGSPGMGLHSRSFVHCLNSNASIYLESFQDTTFLIDSINVLQNNGEVMVIHSSTFSCFQLNSTAIIYDISNKSLIQPFDLGATLNNDLGFSSFATDQNFIRGNGGLGLELDSSNFDTTFYTSIYTIAECYDFPQDNYKYIGVKVMANGIDKLGWIKLKISSDRIISISESALQF